MKKNVLSSILFVLSLMLYKKKNPSRNSRLTLSSLVACAFPAINKNPTHLKKTKMSPSTDRTRSLVQSYAKPIIETSPGRTNTPL